MIDWCAAVLDGGSLGTSESSMAKVAVADALFRADRCSASHGRHGRIARYGRWGKCRGFVRFVSTMAD